MYIKPAPGYAIAEVISENPVTESGIVLVASQDILGRAKVVYVGDPIYKEGVCTYFPFEKGITVFYTKSISVELPEKDGSFVLLHRDNVVLGISESVG